MLRDRGVNARSRGLLRAYKPSDGTFSSTTGEGLSEASWLAAGLSVTLCLLAAVSRRLHNKLCHWAVAAELLMVQLLIF